MFSISVLIIISLSMIYLSIYLWNKNSLYKWTYEERIRCQKIQCYYTCEIIIDDDVFTINYFAHTNGCIIMNVYLNNNSVLVRDRMICIYMPFLVHSFLIKMLVQSNFKRIARIHKNG